ncbi:hypothetical protein BDA99DRAFT_580362 [Phascolomyces articulosus]|uniref:Uncharacterized protein n=1 Tax=Phascolomyces articulosus TaxID=60185 RepID=A0AAD5KAU5_9FUNG|nr:hypothetical protein BDA99DRAFT_580362 [Phascolomyces articulosus]
MTPIEIFTVIFFAYWVIAIVVPDCYNRFTDWLYPNRGLERTMAMYRQRHAEVVLAQITSALECRVLPEYKVELPATLVVMAPATPRTTVPLVLMFFTVHHSLTMQKLLPRQTKNKTPLDIRPLSINWSCLSVVLGRTLLSFELDVIARKCPHGILPWKLIQWTLTIQLTNW